MREIEKLKQFRKSENLSVDEISKEIGVNKHTYYKIESGVRKPTYEFMDKFKQRFGVSIDEMFF